MSAALTTFLDNATHGNWEMAFPTCDCLSMTEMLEGLSGLQRGGKLDDFRAQMAVFAPRVNMPRIQYAVDVVTKKNLPASAPGDLESTHQVDEARQFLLKTQAASAAARKKPLRIALFWTVAAQSEHVSSALITKANRLLDANHTNLVLLPTPYHNVVPYQAEVVDTEACENSELRQILSLVEKSAGWTGDRLPVVFYSADTSGLDARGNPQPDFRGYQHGCTGTSPTTGKRFCMINVKHINQDFATLLHEVGHGAEITPNDDGEGDQENFMSYGSNRTKIRPEQIRKLTDSYFCRTPAVAAAGNR